MLFFEFSSSNSSTDFACESFSMDEMETYELKRYMQLKKEIIGIKKGIYFS